jgi:hypothetical protein
MSDLCKICGGVTHETWCDGILYDRIDNLEAQLYEVREIYMGMEGIPKNLYTTEAYLMYIIKQMYEAAAGNK